MASSWCPSCRELIGRAEIETRLDELASRLSEDYRDTVPLVVCVLKGAFVFLADLVRRMEIPLKTDFMSVSSYGASTRSSGVVRILKDLDTSIQDRDVILLEDIVDTGLTLHYLLELLEARKPRTLRTCVLLDKEECRVVPVDVHYRGFKIPNEFVVGYGLDYDQNYRHLPYIGVLEQGAEEPLQDE